MADNYRKDYLELALKQELALRAQVKREINAFTFRYARTYQNSAITYAEDILYNRHLKRVKEVLERRYRIIYPKFSRFVLNDFYEDVTKSKLDLLIDMTDRLVSAYILEKALNSAKEIANTSLKNVRNAINLGVIDGLGISEIAANIRGVSKISSNRAETIARTEVHSATNRAMYDTAQNAKKELSIEMEKEWVSTLDGRTRDTHMEINGQTRSLDDKFDVGGFKADAPLDPALPAKEVINCRCVVAYRRKRYDIE